MNNLLSPKQGRPRSITKCHACQIAERTSVQPSTAGEKPTPPRGFDHRRRPMLESGVATLLRERGEGGETLQLSLWWMELKSLHNVKVILTASCCRTSRLPGEKPGAPAPAGFIKTRPDGFWFTHQCFCVVVFSIHGSNTSGKMFLNQRLMIEPSSTGHVRPCTGGSAWLNWYGRWKTPQRDGGRKETFPPVTINKWVSVPVTLLCFAQVFFSPLLLTQCIGGTATEGRGLRGSLSYSIFRSCTIYFANFLVLLFVSTKKKDSPRGKWAVLVFPN